ncbi:MAG: DUF3187 family protein [Vicinamibacteria bacterium]
MRRSALLAALAVCCLSRPADAQSPGRRGPLDVREEWLLAQQRLTLPAVSPDPLPRGGSEVRAAADWGSDWGIRGPDGDLAYLVDGEHRTFSVEARRGVTDRLTLGVRVPLHWRGAGVLDGVIDWWHRLTGLPDNDRFLYPTGRFRVEGRDRDGRPLVFTGSPGAGLGNLEASALWAVRRDPDGAALSLVARADLPTGSGPYASAGAHGALQAVAAVPLAHGLDLYSGLGGTLATQAERDGIHYRKPRLHGFLVLEWRPARRLSLLAEANGSSRLVTNAAAYRPFQLHLRIGAKLDLGTRTRLEAGFVEGLSVQNTTDFGVQTAVRVAF